MSNQERAYKLVEAARKKKPGVPITRLFRQLNVRGSAYYAYKRKVEGLQSKVTYKRLQAKAPERPATGNMVFIMGSPEQIREVMGGVL